ncbi:MAG: RdgB/HAM1 family non-canonical purine NTP pyrophosphatase [Verrucomicrobia bacterium]|nr:RdgB/HAM1 family non-canonical purine NTP pyrophosphatase [Verrucomicrobiota bacterium]
MLKIIVATGNQHKADEIRNILNLPAEIQTLHGYPAAPVPVEDKSTFAGNAIKKSHTIARWFSLQDNFAGAAATFVMADDSGLEVDILNGAPGIYSARFAALDNSGHINSIDADNNEKLLGLLDGVPLEKRSARFRCAIAVAGVGRSIQSDGNREVIQLFEGICEGTIGLECRGTGGFGYDPLFIPDGFDKTFGELPRSVKNDISHRAKAIRQAADFFKAIVEQ